jgi:hypothetical protein
MDQRTNELNRGGSPYSTGGVRTSSQIRADIDARRAEMDMLATTLRDRLSPQEIAHEVKRSLQGRGVRMASSLLSSVRENPVPWMVIGTGLAWLVKESRSRSGHDSLGYLPTYGTLGQGAYGPTYGEPSYGAAGLTSGGLGATPYSEPSDVYAASHEHGAVDTAREKVSEVKERTADALERGKDKAIHAKDAVVEKATHVKDVMVDKTHDAKESLADFGERTADRTRLLSQRARVQARTTADESPLLLALGLLGVGALIGAAIPTSRREDELMGPVRDNLLEQAKSKGQEVAHKVSRIAEVATSEAGRATDESRGDAGEKIVAAVEGAVSGARLEAERQGLSTSDDAGDGRVASGSRGSASTKDNRSSVTASRTSSERSFGLPSDGLSGLTDTSGTSGSSASTGSPVRRASSPGSAASEVNAPGSSTSSPSRSTLGSPSPGISPPRTPSASSSPSTGSSWSSPSAPGSSTPTQSTSGPSSSATPTARPAGISSPSSPSEQSGRPERGGFDEASKEPRR